MANNKYGYNVSGEKPAIRMCYDELYLRKALSTENLVDGCYLMRMQADPSLQFKVSETACFSK